MPPVEWLGLVQAEAGSQEPHLDLSRGVESQELGSLSGFSGARTGSWIGSRPARTQTNALHRSVHRWLDWIIGLLTSVFC